MKVLTCVPGEPLCSDAIYAIMKNEIMSANVKNSSTAIPNRRMKEAEVIRARKENDDKSEEKDIQGPIPFYTDRHNTTRQAKKGAYHGIQECHDEVHPPKEPKAERKTKS